MTYKELLFILKFLNKFRGIIFGCEINVFSNHKNLVYFAALSESQIVMLWKIILEVFGPNIQYISGVDNIVADKFSRFTYKPVDNYKPVTMKYYFH